VNATVYSPTLEISQGKATCTTRVKAYAKVSGKLASIGESIKLEGGCVLEPVVRLERLDGDAKAADVAISLDELGFQREMLCGQFTVRERS
jgi:hypothetical protein